jgi:outer membrane protein TolC
VEEDNTYLATLHWGWNRTAVAQARAALDEARRGHTHARRDGCRQALLAHASLWDAQATSRAAALRLSAAALKCTETERRFALGAVAAVDVETAKLDEEDAALAVAQAGHALAAALLEAKRLALLGDADPITLTFRLPDAAADAAPAYRASLWAVKTAEARHAQARWDLLPAVSLNGQYMSKDRYVTSTLSTRGPGVDIAGQTLATGATFNPGAQGSYLSSFDKWQFVLRADLPLSLGAWSGARVAAQDARLAKVQLAQTKAQLAVQIPQARGDVASAQEGLRLAKQRAALAAKRLEAMKARVLAGSAGQTDLLLMQAAAGDAESTVARGWKTYVAAVAAYLELVDGNWEEAP